MQLIIATARKKRTPFQAMPGFGLSLGFTLFYLTLIVLIPLAAVFLKTFTLTWDAFQAAVTSDRVVASYKLTFGASLLALVTLALKSLIAWHLANTGAEQFQKRQS